MKYIIDVPEKEMMYINTWEYKDGKCVWTNSYTISDLRPYVASESYIDGLRKGQEEVWGFLKALYVLSDEELYEIFPNGCAYEMTYQEAETKYKVWKKRKDEIRVGDEVEYNCCDETVKFIVMGIIGGDTAYGFKYPCDYDDSGEYCVISDLKKTGRHFNEVEELLKKMKED